MATELLMPKLGLTMEEGTILQWLVADGATIEPGMAIMLIETDKVESEVEASATGRLHRLAQEGQAFACGTVIGLLLGEDESPPAAVVHVAVASSVPPTAAVVSVVAPLAIVHPVGVGGRRFVSPNARRLAAERNLDLDRIVGTGPGGRVVSEDLDNLTSAQTGMPLAGGRGAPWAGVAPGQAASSAVPATAAGRQLADLLGVDLYQVPADPVDGYVTRESVARYVRGQLQQRAGGPIVTPQEAVAANAPPPATQTPTKIKRLAGMRGTIAKRMHASLHEMAQLTLTMDADMEAVVADRRTRSTAGKAPTYTDYIVAAVARALRIHPGVNSQVTPDGIAMLPDIHVGLAVAVDDGLMVPVIQHADRLALDELAKASARLAEAARSGSLTVEELSGGTFSVSTLGTFGVDAFTPVVNPPNVAILGVGRIRDDVVLVDGIVGNVKRMTLSLTWDHRVLDGAPAAAFCSTIVELLQKPTDLA
jgi:pyruvate dehydrogenase E2 component (dihydrolipoamide acetyltransferase)